MSTSSSPPSRRVAVARYVTGAVASLYCLIAIAGCLWRPDELAALTLVAPFWWLVGGLLTLPILWRLGQKRLAAGLAAFWLLFAIGWVEQVPSFARLALAKLTWTTTPPGQTTRIVSLNCSGSERSVMDLKRVNPDIVLLQEAPGEEALARMTAELFGEVGQFCTARDVAILARGTVCKQVADKRGTFVAARVQLPDADPVNCVSLRLDPPPSRLDFWTLSFWTEHRDLRQMHLRQLTQILAAVSDQQAAATILGGDFNTLPLDAALDELRLRFHDCFASSGVGWGATGTNSSPIFRVDQIWINARLLPQRTVAEKTMHSDHRMVIGDVKLRR